MSSTGVHSGRVIDLQNMKPEDFCMDDIIWHLSRIARWSGGTSVPFSVLEHVLYCDDIYCYACPFDLEDRKDEMRDIGHPVSLADKEQKIRTQIRLDILFHDAHEFILSDIPTAVKESISGLKELIAEIDANVRKRLGFLWCDGTSEVKYVDKQALIGEASVFMPREVYQRVKLDHENIEPTIVHPTLYGPELASMEFRSRVAELMEML